VRSRVGPVLPHQLPLRRSRCLLQLPAATPDEDKTASSSSFEFNEKDGTLRIEWSGPIVLGMADYLRGALDKYAAASHRVVLFLNSAGGQVDEGDRVIHLLDGIKPTHRLITVVLDGSLCASMCIPVFLPGPPARDIQGFSVLR
jgi:hypothetical protein